LGDFEVTALNDGVVPYPTAQLLPTATPEQVEIALADCALKDPVGMSYNAFLINTGSKLVLIDMINPHSMARAISWLICARPATNPNRSMKSTSRTWADDFWVAGGHLTFPAIGHIRTDQQRYFWIPANYSLP
jgi:hypothetical protein